jgi:hypothetical protein
MLMQYIQIDPRMMDVFKELTGIDLMEMQNDKMKNKDRKEEQQKKDAEEATKRHAEEEKKKKQA